MSNDIRVNGHTKTLNYAGQTINGTFDCGTSRITSLIGSPFKVIDSFACNRPKVKSLEGCPQDVGKDFYIHNSGIVALGGIHTQVRRIGGTLWIPNRLLVNILGVLKIRDLKEVCCHYPVGCVNCLEPAVKIINKYLQDTPNPRDRDIHKCQEELIEAGLKRYASLGDVGDSLAVWRMIEEIKEKHALTAPPWKDLMSPKTVWMRKEGVISEWDVLP